MKASIFLGVATVIQCFVSGLVISPRQNTPGVIQAPVWRRDQTRSIENDRIRRSALSKRATSGTVSLTLDNPPSKLLYYANITIGTPGQPIALQIDTGSSDIWTEVPYSRLCQSRRNPCAASGTYDNTTSSTYAFVNSDFRIQYADGTQAVGDYATETFNIGGAEVKNMEFGVGAGSTSTEGVLGVGFAANEAIVQFVAQPYPNLVDQMVSQNFIQSQTYSLYLNDRDASSGNILFGGVDTEKFSGTLATLPINNDINGRASAFVITLTGLSLSPPSGSTVGIGSSSLYPLNVLLDSGSSFMSLPSQMVEGVAQAMGATYSPQLDGYILPSCDSQSASGSLNFFFSGVKISVPYDELIVTPTGTNGLPFRFGDGTLVCMLGFVLGTSNDIAVLGDTFLRSAYVVYDLGNSQISLGQTKFNASTSNIEAIPAGKGKVPSASAVANPTTLTFGSFNVPKGGGPTGTGGAIGTETGGSSHSAASGNGLFGSGRGLVFGLSTCIGIVVGAWLAL